MKFLVDENLPNALAAELSTQGFDVVKATAGSSDAEVSALAQKDKRVLLTLDKDFADIISYPPSEYHGIICFRLKHPVPTSIMRSLRLVLSNFENDSISGRLIVVNERGFRIR